MVDIVTWYSCTVLCGIGCIGVCFRFRDNFPYVMVVYFVKQRFENDFVFSVFGYEVLDLSLDSCHQHVRDLAH